MRTYYCMVLLGLYSSVLSGMENKNCQLDVCPTRKIYLQQNAVNNQSKEKICFFCDSETLKKNYIISEDVQSDVRVMMNKNPYPAFDQAIHLLIMPISHKEHPGDFSQKELTEHSDAVRNLSEKLYANAYTQEYFTSWGKLAGQSVPHWHSHFKNYTMSPLSLPEMMRYTSVITTMEEAFAATKALLGTSKVIEQQFSNIEHNKKECLCCVMSNEQDNDERNLVVARFKHNYVCLPHYPRHPGEIVVVPNRHVASIKDLLQEELKENTILAMALFPRMKEYVQANIHESDGGNLYTKSMGGKASIDQQKNHHVYTVVIPRTTLFFFPGTMDGNSCKLECDPIHLFAYLKEKIEEIKAMFM